MKVPKFHKLARHLKNEVTGISVTAIIFIVYSTISQNIWPAFAICGLAIICLFGIRMRKLLNDRNAQQVSLETSEHIAQKLAEMADKHLAANPILSQDLRHYARSLLNAANRPDLAAQLQSVIDEDTAP